MKKAFIEDDEIFDDEEDEMEDELEDELELDIFEDGDEDLEQISSYWKTNNPSSGGYGKRKKTSRFSFEGDY